MGGVTNGGMCINTRPAEERKTSSQWLSPLSSASQDYFESINESSVVLD